MTPFATPLSGVAVGVWQDRNADGIQQAAEPGLLGVAVTLSSAATRAVVATTVTDSTGRYLSDRLPTGSYRIGFGLLPTCAYTVAGRVDPTVDSDADPFSGLTAPISLAPGAANLRSPVAADGSVQAGSFDPTVDAGVVCSTSSTTQLGVTPARLPAGRQSQTEAWLDLTVNASGQGIATTTVPFIPSAASRLIVIYTGPTASSGLPTGSAGACLPLVIG